MKRITHNFLYNEGACDWQRKLFRELYPKGIEVCWKCFQEAQNQGLEVYWLGRFVDRDAQFSLACRVKSRARRFPHLNYRDPFYSWVIPVLTVKGLKLLEQELLKRT